MPNKRCLTEGFASIHMPKKQPCLVTPAPGREILLLEMANGTPHFNLKIYQKSRAASRETMFKATGVRLVNDEIVVGDAPKSQRKNKRFVGESCPCGLADDCLDAVYVCYDCEGPSPRTRTSHEEHASTDADKTVIAAPAQDDNVALEEAAETPGWDPSAPPQPERSAANWENIKAQWQPDEPPELTDKERTAANWAEMQRCWVALHEAHCIHHAKHHPRCEACVRAKTTKAYHLSHKLRPRQLLKFGDLTTCDSINMSKEHCKHEKAIGGYRELFTVLDLATQFVAAIPFHDLSGPETMEGLQQFIGPDQYISQIYSDNFGSIIQSCKAMGILHRPAPPGDHASNTLIEGLNRRIEEATRCWLANAGLPICWYPYAVQHWAFLRNCHIKEDASPYCKRFGKELEGTRGFTKVPFGAGVMYYPTTTKYVHQHKCEARLCYGIVVGYGTQWRHMGRHVPVFPYRRFCGEVAR